MSLPSSVVVVGAGIVGLALANELSNSGVDVTVLEKEAGPALHQTSRNSGVIHAGPYYKVGSLKAQLCHTGNKLMVDFAKDSGVPFEITGKLIVATQPEEIAYLNTIAERAEQNGVKARIIGRSEILEIEPHCGASQALHVRKTGIIDFGGVAKALVRQSESKNVNFVFNSKVLSIREELGKVVVRHKNGVVRADYLVNAAGLFSDQIAIMAGFFPKVRIFPFRGEYFELSEEKKHLVKGLIYPTPKPETPFLGVHLTRMISGSVHAGPNAILAMNREGYSRFSVNLAETVSMFSFPGFPKFVKNHLRLGAEELHRSTFKSKFAKDLSRLVPGIEPDDLVKSQAGVRAQAMGRDGKLIDDFVFEATSTQLHVLNAPSPAATASFAIAKHLVSVIMESRH